MRQSRSSIYHSGGMDGGKDGGKQAGMRRRGNIWLWLGASLLVHVLFLLMLPSPSREKLQCPIMLLIRGPKTGTGVDAPPAAAAPPAGSEAQPEASPRTPLQQVKPQKDSAPTSMPVDGAKPSSDSQGKTQDAPPAKDAGAPVGGADSNDSAAGGDGKGEPGGMPGGVPGGIPGGVPGGVPGGDPDGQVGGDGDSKPAPIKPPVKPEPEKPKPEPKPEKPKVPDKPVEPATPAIDVKALMQKYGAGVKREIKSNKRMPAAAERLGHTGSVKLRITVSRSGSLDAVEVVGSSGYDELDSAALEAVRAAAPFGEFPEGVDKQAFSFTYSLNFDLS